MVTENRMTGVVNVVAGLGGIVAATCFVLAGLWWTLPVAGVAFNQLLAGAMQIVTGADEDY